ncbi:MAG: SDR family NAD(P)-dependent oxidoreductase, partial [Eubacteriales bacterium]|nr:SDR family NAD(P)-dependent oxidoreductase [Eubacteriales bacterium]
MNSLKGKTVVVTGGSRGIGKSVCLEFAKAGANVAFLYVGNKEKAGEALEEIRAVNADIKVKSYKCSVTDAEEVKKTFTDIVAEFGRA